MPRYKGATYSGESVVLENAHLRLEVHKRTTGWGWGEIYAPTGQMMAVLEHLGELKLPDLVVPLRIEAADYAQEPGAFGQRLTFEVKLTGLNDMVAASRLRSWFKSPITQPMMEGTVTLTLDPDAPVLHLAYRLKPLSIFPVAYLRGPWLKVGADSFGSAKDDGIFPGVEWLTGDEWSSGTDWFRDPWALRVAPHPYKVSAPVMAVSWDGTGIGLAWDPLARCVSHRRYPQPVYASPDFLERTNDHIMGLMLPSVAWGASENALQADPPLQLRTNQTVRFNAEVFLVQGDSLDVLVDWVKRHGLPGVPEPRYPLLEALDRIARAYDSNLWHEGAGWGGGPWAKPSPTEPAFVGRYITEGRDREVAKGLAQKLAWVRSQPEHAKGSRDTTRFEAWEPAQRLAHGRDLLAWQREDGSFPFEPEGRHSRPEHHRLSEDTVKPLGRAGDTALDLCAKSAMELLQLADITGEESFRDAARRALDFCLPMERPEGGDWWETPLHSPNLLAGGHAAIAYYLGYRAFDDPRYLERAIHWIRSLLAFTHLWQPYDVPQVYNTKPCLCATDWWLANWVQNHVQWEALVTFAMSSQLGIDWGEIDPEIDWHRYQKGITVAVLRWMIDHEDTVNTTYPLDQVESGAMDALWADVHDSTTGIYAGGPIMPDMIAQNIYAVLDRERR